MEYLKFDEEVRLVQKFRELNNKNLVLNDFQDGEFYFERNGYDYDIWMIGMTHAFGSVHRETPSLNITTQIEWDLHGFYYGYYGSDFMFYFDGDDNEDLVDELSAVSKCRNLTEEEFFQVTLLTDIGMDYEQYCTKVQLMRDITSTDKYRFLIQFSAIDLYEINVQEVIDFLDKCMESCAEAYEAE